MIDVEEVNADEGYPLPTWMLVFIELETFSAHVLDCVEVIGKVAENKDLVKGCGARSTARKGRWAKNRDRARPIKGQTPVGTVGSRLSASSDSSPVLNPNEVYGSAERMNRRQVTSRCDKTELCRAFGTPPQSQVFSALTRLLRNSRYLDDSKKTSRLNSIRASGYKYLTI